MVQVRLTDGISYCYEYPRRWCTKFSTFTSRRELTVCEYILRFNLLAEMKRESTQYHEILLKDGMIKMLNYGSSRRKTYIILNKGGKSMSFSWKMRLDDTWRFTIRAFEDSAGKVCQIDNNSEIVSIIDKMDKKPQDCVSAIDSTDWIGFKADKNKEIYVVYKGNQYLIPAFMRDMVQLFRMKLCHSGPYGHYMHNGYLLQFTLDNDKELADIINEDIKEWRRRLLANFYTYYKKIIAVKSNYSVIYARKSYRIEEVKAEFVMWLSRNFTEHTRDYWDMDDFIKFSVEFGCIRPPARTGANVLIF